MKERIQKLSEGIATAAKLLKEENTSEAIEALGAVADEVAGLATEVETAETEAVEKSTKIAELEASAIEKETEIKKYADLYVSAETLGKLLEDLGAVRTGLTDIAKSVETVAKSEDITSINARLEAIEKTSSSRQISEEERNTIQKASGLSEKLGFVMPGTK